MQGFRFEHHHLTSSASRRGIAPRRPESCDSASARVGAQHLARVDVHGHGAGAAVPGGARGRARRAVAAAQPQRRQGRRVRRAAPADRPVAGPPAVLRGVLQLLVHRHLRAAVRLAGGLFDAADDRTRPHPARGPGRRTPQPGPAAQARRGRAGRRPRRARRGHGRAAARLAHGRAARRRRRRRAPRRRATCASSATSFSTSRCWACW